MKLLNFVSVMRFFEVCSVLTDRLPKDLANLVIDYLRYPVEPWDAYDLWVPEYDSQGSYGAFPMCPIEQSGVSNEW
jgi:hypothetical protein